MLILNDDSVKTMDLRLLQMIKAASSRTQQTDSIPITTTNWTRASAGNGNNHSFHMCFL